MSLDKSFPNWWSRRLDVHLKSKLFLFSSWKRIYQYTECKCATRDSFCVTKLCNGMVSSLFKTLFHPLGESFLFIESYLHDSCWFIIMATTASKRKLNTKSIKDKYSALKEVEDGKTKSQIAIKYGKPKNTWSTWLKNKDKILEVTKKGSNSKWQWLRQGTFTNLDQALLKWHLVVRSRDVAVSALVFKTIAIEFAE